MARIAAFMLCDAINNINAPDGSTVPQLVSPRTVIRPSIIPGSFSFGIAIGIEDIDLKQRNKIKFEIVSPDGEILQASGENELPIFDNNDDILPVEYQGFTLSIDIRNLVIKNAGVYKFKFFVNDNNIGTQRIPIFGTETK